jgi:hypothetical protein
MLTIDKFRGSLPRCLLLTYLLPRIKTAKLLTDLAKPSGAVVLPENDTWLPRSLVDWKEATLIEEYDFLDTERCRVLKDWWLSAPRGANPPNWDIASTCSINRKKGLLLVEAKAHEKELSEAGKSEPDTLNSNKNHQQIGNAIEQANNGLNSAIKGWALSRDSHYQLSNRFAWSWKLASLGIPVVLIYLGFLNAVEMIDQGQPFDNAKTWEKGIRSHAKDRVPDNAWNKRLDVGGTPLWCLIKSMEVTFNIL